MSDEQLNYRVGEIFRSVTNLVEQGKEQDKKLELIDQKLGKVSGQLNDIADKVISREGRIRVLEDGRSPTSRRVN